MRLIERRIRSADGERGIVLVLTAVSMLAVLAIAAIVVDIGGARQAARHFQASSDAGALAGAQDLPLATPNPTMAAAARDTAARYTATNVLGRVVDPTATACSGSVPANASCYVADDLDIVVASPYTGSVASSVPPHNLIFVRVCGSTDTFFAGTIGQASPDVCREAVARYVSASGGYGMGLVALHPSKCAAMDFSGNSGTRLSSNGAVLVNSSCASSALSASGSSWDLETSFIGVVGGSNLNPCEPPTSTQCTTTVPMEGMNPFPDPLGLTPPDPTGMPLRSCSNELRPGRYVTQCRVNSGVVTVRPGLYYFERGVRLNPHSVVCADAPVMPPFADPMPPCAGVTFFIASGSAEINGNAALHLPPPTTGPYAGVSIYQASTDESTINGSSYSSLGTIYAPNAHLKVTGNGHVNVVGSVIGGTVEISGNFDFDITVPEEAPEYTPEPDIGLEE